MKTIKKIMTAKECFNAPVVFMCHVKRSYGSYYCSYMLLPKGLPKRCLDTDWFAEEPEDYLESMCHVDDITLDSTLKRFLNIPIIPISGNILDWDEDTRVIGWDFMHLDHEEKGVNDDFEWCRTRTLEMVNRVICDVVDNPDVTINE